MKKCKVKIISEEFDKNLEVGEETIVDYDAALEYEEAGLVEIISKKEEPIKVVKKEEEKELPIEKVKELLEEVMLDIQKIIKYYSDIEDKYVPLISAWIIGTYIHKEFPSYPYLFLNAMRGSGKTRLLKLISVLAHKGIVTNNLTEAVLFRTGAERTLCIDEFEQVGSKESSTLREILNSAYKRGATIERMKKKKTPDGEDYIIESFNIYMPIVMANIWGMEEVLGDRCIKIILEKSNKNYITKLFEDFEESEHIRALKGKINKIQCSLCSVVTKKNMYIKWNNYIKDKYFLENKTTLTTFNTYNNNNTYNYTDLLNLFNKIDSFEIQGRQLELMFPLFMVAYSVGEEYLNIMLKIAKDIVKENKKEEYTESRDVLTLDFVSQLKHEGFVKIKDLFYSFKIFIDDEEKDSDWVNSKWLGRALKRLRLVIDKRRISSGIEVRLDLVKAKEKILMFK